VSQKGKHAPSSPASFYASLGRHAAGGVAVVAVVALVIGLATRDDDGAGVAVTSPTASVSPSVEVSPSASASPTATETETPEREPRAREEITITVLNGNGTSGLAGDTSQRLVAAGFTVNDVGDAELRDNTAIFYAKGAKIEAELLLEEFPELLRIKPAEKSTEFDAASLLTVILGEDYET
jgi:hypothetical protein